MEWLTGGKKEKDNTEVFSEQRKNMIEAVKGMTEEQAKVLYELTKHLMK